jgi:hypothetical protein
VGDGQLEIVPDFLFPDREALMPEINLEERALNARGRLPFRISVWNEAQSKDHGLVKCNPAPEGEPIEVERLILHGAIEFVHDELVLNNKVGDERLVLPPSRCAEWHVSELCSLW